MVGEEGTFLEGAKIRFSPAPKSVQENTVNEPPSGVSRSIAAEQASSLQAPSSQAEPAGQGLEPEPQTGAEQDNAITGLSPETSCEVPQSAALPTLPEPPDDANQQPLVSEAHDQVTTASLLAQEDASITQAPAAEPTTTVNAIEPPSEPERSESSSEDQIQQGRKIFLDLLSRYKVRAISIGTGAGARELENVLRQILSEEGLNDVMIASVNDAGVAVYSSSRIGREELPDLTASTRRAVSLARRLQDPLAELVKIDPKLIGVGQYQHDVDQKELHRGLLQTVQYCVNKVGVNVNKASETLLRYVSGLNEKLARRIVAVRRSHGPFRSRASLASVAGLDKTTYEQAAGFLRIPDGENVLDRTAIHPESYPIVEKMAAALNVSINDLVGNKELLASLSLEQFADETVGIPTLSDIREELLRPGRDPRKSFKAPRFRPDVKEITDLKVGMTLEGTVTNVTNFGAFVDIGVKQDGLVHLSQMSNRFIRDAREAVKVGNVVQVKVISIEPETKRIGLSMKALLPPAQRRRKKQLRRKIKGTSSAAQPEASPAVSADDGMHSPAPTAGANDAEAQSRARKYDGTHQRSSKRGSRRQKDSKQQQQPNEPASKLPEPTLQEKIAILQSKFRGLS